ncbi:MULTISPECIES: hypothetical protein [unclassified Fibrobacter]|uniref:hypothetical protein n=1 Tax=unclassified Fibrobacter TaxID=2634177 RepID=UPI0011609239|nr:MULTISPECIES: hypothetical protein [unclassified Fibrobacter]
MKYCSVLLLALFVSACSFKAKVLNADNSDVTPLDSRTPVAFVLAKEVPVVPENGIYRGTFETTSNDACTLDRMIDVTVEKARHAGANFIYAKRIKDVYVPGTSTYVGGAFVTTAGRNCVTILADFYYAETPAQAKFVREQKGDAWKK